MEAKEEKWMKRGKRFISIIRNNKKALISVVVIVLLIVFSAASVICVQSIRKHRKSGTQEEMDIQVMNMTQELTMQEETEEETTEEETEEPEEESEEVEEAEVEQFFENEVSTESQEALDLPTRRLSAEFIPYDGKSRQISYFGDSMVYGIGSTSIAAVVDGRNINGCTAPDTIQHFTGIRTYNFGVPGETSYEIAYRAGGVRLHTDRTVTISEDDSANVRLIDESGNVFTFDDYSGYAYEDNPYSSSMYINNYLCSVENAGDDEVRIQLVRGYAAYNMEKTEKEAVVMSVDGAAEPVVQAADVQIQPVAADQPQVQQIEAGQPQAQVQQIEAGQPQTPAATQATGGQPAATQPAATQTQQPTATQTQQATIAPTEAPTQVPLIGRVEIPEGSAAEPKAARDHSQKDILILEIGSNGGWENDYQTLILQYDNIILNAGCDYYIIVGDTDDPGTSIGDYNQGEYNEDGSYIGIGDTSWEAALREAYGEHFFNTRTYIIQNGLNICGLKTTTQDLENFKRGNISKQLRYDWTHFNAYGYYAKGVGIYEKGKSLGYWS